MAGCLALPCLSSKKIQKKVPIAMDACPCVGVYLAIFFSCEEACSPAFVLSIGQDKEEYGVLPCRKVYLTCEGKRYKY